jgi:hypothetical protein
VLFAILIVVIAAAIARAVTDLLTSLLSSVSGGQLMAKGAGVAILVFAAFAALDQLKIAPRIVTGLWYAILAIVVGSAVVAIGGGGIKSMQRYWERAPPRPSSAAPRSPSKSGSPRNRRPSTRVTGQRPTPTPRRPRRLPPSGPAVDAATARSIRRRDASAGYRGRGVSPQPSHHPSQSE